MRWLPLLLAAPLVAAGIGLQHDVTTPVATQDTLAPLSAGDVGSTVLGTSAADADITVSAISILVTDDILDLTSTDASWQVHAELDGFTGFGALQSITLALRDGTNTETQIVVAGGVASQTSGNPVDLPTSQDTELTAVAAAGSSGTLALTLVLAPDAGGPEIRKTVDVTV